MGRDPWVNLMVGPLPCIDPNLESGGLWPVFHHQLITALQQALEPQLSDRYFARVVQRQYPAEATATAAGGLQNVQEDCLEVRERLDGRLVTLIDVVSPANKNTDVGRQAFQATHAAARNQGASDAEIDLLPQGRPMRALPQGLPAWDYLVTVTRATHPDRLEIYAARLPLPRFRVPLGADDRDAVLDLHTAAAKAFDQGSIATTLGRPRSVTTSERAADEHWFQHLLVPRRLQPPNLPHVLCHEHIAVAAYYLWEHEGRPHGRDWEHWFRAIEQLLRAKG
jgi:hypothetical protein